MQFKGVIFDIDGTISDTLPLCIASFQQTLFEFTGRIYPENEITAHFGKTEAGMMQSLLPDRMPQIYQRYCQVFEQLHQQVSRPVQGVNELFEYLANCNIQRGIVTGRGMESTLITLRIFNLLSAVDVIECGSAIHPSKTESLLRASKRLNISPSELIYIGDTPVDIQSAVAAGMSAAGAAWASLATLKPEAEPQAVGVFRSVNAFADWLKPHLACNNN